MYKKKEKLGIIKIYLKDRQLIILMKTNLYI